MPLAAVGKNERTARLWCATVGVACVFLAAAEARTQPHVLFTRSWITAQNKPLGGRNSCTANYRLQAELLARYTLDTPKNALFSLATEQLEGRAPPTFGIGAWSFSERQSTAYVSKQAAENINNANRADLNLNLDWNRLFSLLILYSLDKIKERLSNKYAMKLKKLF